MTYEQSGWCAEWYVSIAVQNGLQTLRDVQGDASRRMRRRRKDSERDKRSQHTPEDVEHLCKVLRLHQRRKKMANTKKVGFTRCGSKQWRC